MISGGPAERSHLINDDASTRFVAATFASGHLVMPTPAEGPAFRPPLVLTRGGRWFGKEYPVLPILLAPAIPLGLEWVVNPLLAGLLVLGTYLFGRSIHGPRAGLLAASLVALSPSLLVLSTSFLNTVLSAVLLTFAAFVWLIADQRDSKRWAVFGGFLFGAALATKPYTAAWMLIPFATIPLSRWRVDRRAALRLAGGLALGVAPWVVAMVLWNVFLTGDPLRTPYQVFQPLNRPGFGADMIIVGTPYTPAVALQDAREQILAFADSFLPLPWLGRAVLALAPIAGWFALRRRSIPLLLAGVTLVVGHFFFFGFRTGSWGLLGSRYLFEASPALALLVACPLVSATRRLRPDVLLAALLAITVAGTVFATVPRAVTFARGRHEDPLIGPNRRLERFLRGLDPAEQRLLFVDISTYNSGSALLTNRPDQSGPNLVAVYREPEQNRLVMNAFADRAAYLVRWSKEGSRFEMASYVPEEDTTGPPQRFPYTEMRQRGALKKDVGPSAITR